MQTEPDNPLIGEPQRPPELPSLPPPGKAAWTAAEKIQTVIGIVALAVAVLQATPTVRSALPKSTQFSYLAVALLIALGSFLLFYGVASLLERRLQRRRDAESRRTSPDRVTELAVLIDKAQKTWALGYSYVASFDQSASTITSALNSGPGQSPSIPPDQRQAADRANYILLGWRANYAAQQGLFWELERLIDGLRTTDRETFVTAILLLRQVILGSSQVASAFADEVRRCDPKIVTDWGRATWADFRDQANRLSADVATLGEKTKRDYGRADLSFYFPPVRPVSTS